MSNVVIPYRYQLRRGTASNLASVNEVPMAGEMIVETDTGLLKVGDGTTHYNSLPYVNKIPAAPCLHFTTDTGSTADSDNGAGLVWWNNATQSSATKLFFDDLTADTGTDLSAYFAELAASSVTGIVHIVAESGAFKLFKWTGVADGTGYFKFTVSHLVSSGGNFADNIPVRVVFYPIGLKDAPSNGNEYVRKDGGWAVSTGGGGGGGNLSYVGQAVVTGSAATTLSISSLDLSTDQEYIIVIDVKNAAGSTSQISLYYNGDTTDANYKRIYVTSSGDSGDNTPRIGGFTAGEVGYINANLRADLNGRPALLLTAHRSTTTPAVSVQTQSTYWTTVANVTQLTLSSSVANGLAVGTKITVYKRAH